MNTDTVKGNWNELKGKVKERWGKLTDDDLTVINGKRDQLVGRLQQIYGRRREDLEREVKEFYDQCGCSANDLIGS